MDNIWQAFRVHFLPLQLALGAILGAALYFSLPVELSWEWVLGGSLAILLLALVWRRFGWRWRWAFLTFILFFIWGKAFTGLLVQEAVIPDHPVWLTGRIVDLERRENRGHGARVRMTVQDVQLYDEGLTQVPKVRFSVHASRVEKAELEIGGGVAAQVMLEPPQPPRFAGDYDGRFYHFFEQRAASGYVRGQIYSTHMEGYSGLWPTFTRWRVVLTERIEAAASPLAAALLTGRRDGLTDTLKDDFRASGLAHLLAISGLHVGLVGGMVFFFLRFCFTLVPRVALTWPTKQIAAVSALFVSLGYMLLAGATIPTIRAAIMVGLLFAAVLLLRPKISLRLWSLAVLLVLALWPYSVVTPSFQMSFAATLILLLWALAQLDDRGPFVPRIGYIRGVIYTGILAGLATLPFAGWHFEHVSLAGILMNLAAVPLMGFWIMPWGLVGLAMMPFGLELLPLWLMEQGLHILRWLAAWGAETPVGGIRLVSPVLVFISLPLIGLVFYFMLRHQRWPAVATFGCLTTLLLFWPTWQEDKIVILNYGETGLVCSTMRTCFVAFQAEEDKNLPEWYARQRDLLLMPAPAACDATGCIWQLKGKTFAYLTAPTLEDCGLVDVLLAPYPLDCPAYLEVDQAKAMEVTVRDGQIVPRLFNPDQTRPWQSARGRL